MREALPHALLIHGPPGIGKSTLASVFAASLLCEAARSDGTACGACQACGWSSQDSHPDLRRLSPGGEEGAEGKEKASREIKIDQVRGLATFVSVGAHRGGRKIVIVEPAEALNTPAANALLKTLEEPAGNTVFLLVSGRADALPATVRSRCVAVAIPLPRGEPVLRWLAQALDEADLHAAARWLDAAGGAPLRALELAQPERAALHERVLDALSLLPGGTPLAAADAMALLPPRDWLPILQTWVADLARVSAGAPPRWHPGRVKRLEAASGGTSLDRVGGFDAWLRRQVRLVEHPLNPRLFCEDVVMRYAAVFDPAAPGAS